MHNNNNNNNTSICKAHNVSIRAADAKATAVDWEQQFGRATRKHPPIAQDWACAIVRLLRDQPIVAQVSGLPAAQRDRPIAQIVHTCAFVHRPPSWIFTSTIAMVCISELEMVTNG